MMKQKMLFKTKPFLLIGFFFIFLGLSFNKWSIAWFFTKNGNISTYFQYRIWVLDLVLILIGCIFIVQKDRAVYRWTGVVVLGTVVIFLLVGFVFRTGYFFQIDYNEGWNVFHSTDALAGKPLYLDRTSLTPINYPPLSFYIVGYVGKIIHNPLMAGRVISLISLLIISLEVGIIIRILGGNNFASIFSFFYCLGMFMVYARGYVAMNDPQMLGHFLMLTGLIIYLKDKSRKIIVALLCCLGIFTKHSLFSILIAISLDILIDSRRDFFKWIGICSVIMGSLLALISVTLGSEFIYQILTPRGFDMQLIAIWKTRLGSLIFVNLILTIPWLYQATNDSQHKIAPIYMLVSIAWGIYSIAGIGSDINLLFDFFIILSIASGMSLFFINSKLESLGERNYLFHIIAPIILGAGILIGSTKLYPQGYTFYQYSEKEKAFLADVSFLSSKTGPVICSNILLCYAAGHAFIYDPYLVTEGIVSGRLEEDDILINLESGYYQVVQLEYQMDDQYLTEQSYTSVRRSKMIFTENFLRALGNNYVLTRKTPTGVYYEPR